MSVVPNGIFPGFTICTTVSINLRVDPPAEPSELRLKNQFIEFSLEYGKFFIDLCNVDQYPIISLIICIYI